MMDPMREALLRRAMEKHVRGEALTADETAVLVLASAVAFTWAVVLLARAVGPRPAPTATNATRVVKGGKRLSTCRAEPSARLAPMCGSVEQH